MKVSTLIKAINEAKAKIHVIDNNTRQFSDDVCDRMGLALFDLLVKPKKGKIDLAKKI
jgi:hypothetical protein